MRNTNQRKKNKIQKRDKTNKKDKRDKTRTIQNENIHDRQNKQ